MDSKEIQKYRDMLTMKQSIIKENAKYAFGKNYGILNAKDTPKPDNRIPVPLAKSAVTDIVGYAGRPGEIKTDYRYIPEPDSEGEADELTELLKMFDEHNKEGLENSELLTKSLSLGIAWELWYISNDLELPKAVMTPEYKILDNIECLPVFDGTLKPKLEKFFRFWKSEDKTEELDVYYPEYSEHYTKKEEGWIANTELDTKYPYKRVPVIPFRTSMDNRPVFAAQKPLIDSFDMIVSKTQNEVDRFNALITLFPGKIDRDFIQKLTEAAKPYIDSLDEYEPDQWPKYLEKNLSGVNEFYQSQADRLERLFHKTIKVPDMSDKEFAGNQSGVAIAYKLIGFEFLVSEIEIYFRQGLESRFDMYKDVIDESTMPTVKWEEYRQDITWNRNLPVDAEAKLRIAAMLQGLGYSQEAISRFVPDSITKESLVQEEEALDHDVIPLGGVPDPVEAVKLSGIQISAANEIINQVAEGIITREAGINQLVVFLNLTPEQANRVMGSQ